jgi:hypothetical protein
MSIVVVTGIGPRSGTSFVMKKAKDAGLPILGEAFSRITVPKHNPDGYWECPTSDPTELDNNISKIWYSTLVTLDPSLISAVVVLERKDKLAQMHSIYKVFKDECKVWPVFARLLDPCDALYEHMTDLNKWLNQLDQNKVMRVYTEDLDSEISSILSFLERGLKWA